MEKHTEQKDDRAVDAVMYLRSLVGSDFDTALHALMKRVGENRKKQQLAVIDY